MTVSAASSGGATTAAAAALEETTVVGTKRYAKVEQLRAAATEAPSQRSGEGPGEFETVLAEVADKTRNPTAPEKPKGDPEGASDKPSSPRTAGGGSGNTPAADCNLSAESAVTGNAPEASPAGDPEAGGEDIEGPAEGPSPDFLPHPTSPSTVPEGAVTASPAGVLAEEVGPKEEEPEKSADAADDAPIPRSGRTAVAGVEAGEAAETVLFTAAAGVEAAPAPAPREVVAEAPPPGNDSAGRPQPTAVPSAENGPAPMENQASHAASVRGTNFTIDASLRETAAASPGGHAADPAPETSGEVRFVQSPSAEPVVETGAGDEATPPAGGTPSPVRGDGMLPERGASSGAGTFDTGSAAPAPHESSPAADRPAPATDRGAPAPGAESPPRAPEGEASLTIRGEAGKQALERTQEVAGAMEATGSDPAGPGTGTTAGGREASRTAGPDAEPASAAPEEVQQAQAAPSGEPATPTPDAQETPLPAEEVRGTTTDREGTGWRTPDQENTGLGNDAAEDAAALSAESGQATERSTNTAPAGVAVDEVAARRSMGRVVRAARLMARTNGGSARILLEPPSLGAVRLEIHVQNRVVSASLTAETRQAAEVMSEQLSLLRQMLERQGLAVERLEVTTEQTGTGRSQGGESGEAGAQWAFASWSETDRSASPPGPMDEAGGAGETSADETPEATQPAATGTPAGLDILA